MMRVVHVINDLDRGGAETVLCRLLAGASDRMDPFVVSLTNDGTVAKEIAGLGVPIECLGVWSLPGYVLSIPRLRTALRRLRPDLVQTWMYHADLTGGIAAKGAGVPAIVWGIHATVRSKERSALLYRAGLATAARLSRTIPTKIVCCSQQAAHDHERVGYDASKVVVIPNGFEGHDPDRSERGRFRKQLGLANDASIVGSIGRYHPDKDHDTFLRAAQEVATERSDVHFVLVGEGLDPSNERIMSVVRSLGLENFVTLFGPTNNVQDIYAAIDVVVCSSAVEALPLALGEAMAVGIPVVSTDVGDAALMLRDPKRVVPVRSPEALARAVQSLLMLSRSERAEIGARDRRMILEDYGLSRMVNGYLDLYTALTS